jgi:hypothetical protein
MMIMTPAASPGGFKGSPEPPRCQFEQPTLWQCRTKRREDADLGLSAVALFQNVKSET